MHKPMQLSLIVFLALQGLLLVGCQRNELIQNEGGTLLGTSPVRFQSADGHLIELSEASSAILVKSLQAEPRYVDVRGLPAAPYGKFMVDRQQFYLFHTFVCDSSSLPGKVWEPSWVSLFPAAVNSNGVPETKDHWNELFDRMLSATNGVQPSQ